MSSGFNNDGLKDLFIACTGWDGPRPTAESLNGIWAGEPSYFIKNIGGEKFESIKLSITAQFDDSNIDRYYHGAAAADINNDGLVDILVVDVTKDWNTQGIYALINKGNFEFEKDYSWITPETTGNTTIERIDIDNDGKLELLVGPKKAALIYKLGEQQFTLWKKIPEVPKRGVILDFIYQKELCETGVYILRSSDLSSGSYYSSITVQRYDFTSRESEVIYDLLEDTGGKWLAWIVPVLDEDGKWPLKPYANTYNYQPALLPVNDFGN